MPLMHPVARPPDALTEKSVGRTLAQVIKLKLHCPLDSLGAKKSIGTNGLCPALTGARNARRWPGRKPLQQFLRPSVPPRITKIQRLEFLVHPCSRLVAIRTRKSESKR
jgi:hypothetical protein